MNGQTGERARGRLVVLNGASSAGKTSVAEALLPLLGPSCVLTGFDDALARARPFELEPSARFDAWRRRLQITVFRLTDGRVRLMARLHREVAALVRGGRDVVVDTALMEPRALRDAAERFAPLGGLFVGVKPPLAVSERWEAARGDRPIGQARRHYDLIHAHGTYDLLLDTSAMSPQECALEIVRRLGDETRPSAFRRLAGR